MDDFHLFLRSPANAGLARMGDAISAPAYEDIREFRDFEFIALWNTYAAIANEISLAGHGGMVIIYPGSRKLRPEHIKIKYESSAMVLRDSFVGFINARHIIGDYIKLLEDGHGVPDHALFQAELRVRDAYDALVEATRFVAGLSGCDGSIIITDDLKLLGFGGEIRAELSARSKIYEVRAEVNKKYAVCDSEWFGMRHRSAVKLASQDHDCTILTVSQDGPITAIWWDNGRVLVKNGVNLANIDMPLA
jgi:hypothetical protein